MSNSDFPLESDAVPATAAARPEQPHIVNLSAAFDMSEFLSEAGDDAPAVDGPPLVRDTAPEPVVPAAESAAPAIERLPAVEPTPVLELPAHLPEPASLKAQPPPPRETVTTLFDLLDKQVGLNWRESIGVVRQLLPHLKKQSPHLPVLLDPRNIEISGSGVVRLLPGQLGGEPLVLQIGRLLQMMVMGKPTPPDLRLLLSQATFELPIFESLDDLDRALAEIERLEDSKDAPAEVPTLPALKAVPPPPGPPRRGVSTDGPLAMSVIRPSVRPRRSSHAGFPPIAALLSKYSTRLVAGSITVALLVALFLGEPAFLFPGVGAPAPSPRIAPGTARVDLPSTPPAGSSSAAVNAPARTADIIAPRASQGERRPLPALETRSASRAPSAPIPDVRIGGAPAPVPEVVPTAGVVAPRESERRAAALLAQGQAAEAAMVFDSLLLANPLYEPKPTDLTPESLAAFRASQKVLLPVLAQRGYERARTALAAGDPERAWSTARETAAILERTSGDPAFRQQVQQLIEEATTARAATDEIIYTSKDNGVVPPRPLSRQFPNATPNGVPPHRVGTLEMVIGKDGTVEFVKLHTPLNRYHERMIVSAAKAWQYRPATKGGRPVKYRLTVTINLPENGTDD
jgi:hypothetical protein